VRSRARRNRGSKLRVPSSYSPYRDTVYQLLAASPSLTCSPSKPSGALQRERVVAPASALPPIAANEILLRSRGAIGSPLAPLAPAPEPSRAPSELNILATWVGGGMWGRGREAASSGAGLVTGAGLSGGAALDVSHARGRVGPAPLSPRVAVTPRRSVGGGKVEMRWRSAPKKVRRCQK